MDILIFIVYLVFFSACLLVYKAEQGSGLTAKQMLIIFLVKVSAGCFNLYIHDLHYNLKDIHYYYRQSIAELETFREFPLRFLNEWLFNWGDVLAHANLLHVGNSQYWTDLGTQIHYKFMTLANIFSLGRLYTNTLFFNFIFFLGALQLLKLFVHKQPQKKWLFVGAIFLLPSVLFWCSGIHKDGWVFMAICFTLYFASSYLQHRKWIYLVYVFIFLLLLLVSRYFIFLSFIFPFLLWFLLHSHKYRAQLFVGAYVAGILLLFVLASSSNINPFEIILSKQKAFLHLHERHDLNIEVLEPTLMSFVKAAPTAIYHVLLKPDFHLADGWKHQFAALDNRLIVACSILFLFYLKRRHTSDLFYTMIFVFACSMYLFIGYTVPYEGAIVRYKSEFTVLLMCSLVAWSEVPFLKRLYT